MPSQTKRFLAMYRAMRKHFGHQHWWPASVGSPAERALEICVGAVLTQNTNWGNVEKALANLRQAQCLSVASLQEVSHTQLAQLVRPAGYFNVKAARLKHFIAAVTTEAGGDLGAYLDRPVAELRPRLLAVNGIGPETADSMILYAAGRCSFVVDAYTYRILLRHELTRGRYDYEAIQHLFETALPRRVGLWNDYHAQLVAVGKHFCTPRAQCTGCPLKRFAHDAGRFPKVPFPGR